MSALTPVSGEVLVNTVTAGAQSPVDAAALGGGGTAVAWLDDSSGASVAKLRLISAAGAPASGEIVVGPAYEVDVAALAGGGFAAAWLETAGSQSSLRVQRYDAAGAPAGPALTLATYDELALARREHPLGLDALGLSDGGFAVSWSVQSQDAFAIKTVFTALSVLNAQGVVEASTGNVSQSLAPPSKALVFYDPAAELLELPGGKLMLTWGQSGPFGAPSAGQHFRLFDLSGAPASDDKLLDAAFPADGGPVVESSQGLSTALLPNGDVVFAWTSGGSVWVSLYPSANLGMGNLTGRTPPQRAESAGAVGPPSVALLEDGGFAVAWSGAGDGGDALARLFTDAGVPDGAAARLGEVATGTQDRPLLVTGGEGLLAVWRDASGTADPSGAGVVVQALRPIYQLTGGAGGDSLAGGAAEDWLLGQGGADTLVGGGGADKFILSEGGGIDRIVDFQGGADRLLVFDAQGGIAGAGRLTWDPAQRALAWDPDGGPGPRGPETLAVLEGVDAIGRDDLAAGFQPRALRILDAEGGYAQQVFDWGGEAYDVRILEVRPSGAAASYRVVWDDGSSWTKWFDHTASQPWESRVAEYDASGAITLYAVFEDGGRHVLTTHDPQDRETWRRIVDEYNAAGRRTARTAVYDDGSSYVATFDAAGAQPWDHVVDTFDAAGQLLGRRTYFDDGSVV